LSWERENKRWWGTCRD